MPDEGEAPETRPVNLRGTQSLDLKHINANVHVAPYSSYWGDSCAHLPNTLVRPLEAKLAPTNQQARNVCDVLTDKLSQ